MVYYLSYLKDTTGNNYLGIKIPMDTSLPFLNTLKNHLSEEEFEIYTKNQQNRDGGSHHITVINVMDYNRLSKEMGISNFVNSLEKAFKYPIDDLKLMGLGTATKNENRAYFIVCNSDKLDDIRNIYKLPNQDFHVTLGFKWRDVFGVPKNVVLEDYSKFLELLKIEFYKKENFNFIRKIGNYKGDPESDIIPLSITDKYLKVYSDGIIMDIGILEEEKKLWIMASYKSENDPKRLPTTEIIKYLK